MNWSCWQLAAPTDTKKNKDKFLSNMGENRMEDSG